MTAHAEDAVGKEQILFLLVGMQTWAATVEIITEVLKKTKTSA